MVLARLHRMLAGSAWTPFADGCVEVCRALTDAFGRPVSLDVHVDEEPDDASLSHGLLLVMAELMTNALKHAGAEPLIVAVTLSRSAWGWSPAGRQQHARPIRSAPDRACTGGVGSEVICPSTREKALQSA